VSSGKVVTSVGYERRFNDALRIEDRERFTAYMDEDQPIKPANILNIVAINQGRRELTRGVPKVNALSPADVEAMIGDGHHLIDTRSSAAWGGGHIAGSINVQMSSSEFEQRVGWVVPDNSPIILLTDKDAQAQACMYNMGFIGLDQHVAGFLEGGLSAWMNSGRPVRTTPQMDVFSLNERLVTNGMRVLDAREQDEWDDGHIQGAVLMPYTQLAPQLGRPPRFDDLGLEKDASIAVTCATGNRSSTAIGLMLREGYTRLYNVTGGMEAWGHARLPMVDATGATCSIG
jgi:hydroxyacylglutathione hydrolase